MKHEKGKIKAFVCQRPFLRRLVVKMLVKALFALKLWENFNGPLNILTSFDGQSG